MTIHRRLIKRNFSPYRLLLNLPLTPANCQARLKWCLARSVWNHADWRRIVFSESRFQLCPNDNRKRVWRRPEQRADFAFLTAWSTGPQAGFMVWGAISFDSQIPFGRH
ncbi:transposable element Tc1 transposase [Trichonephila clavipes]|nr:transposable element Tc1 transposase [Trichonephila clavipes]